MAERIYKYLYGPVPSRRLGRSLGVDLVPHKICTYDCIYCQLGKTTNQTTERLDYVPVQDVLSELKEKLSAGVVCDYIGIAGSGEPTLHASIGEIIGKIKEMTNIPVTVLTNGSLLFIPEVRQALMKADIVIPSLDAGNDQLFQYVNRPHTDISFERMVQGLIDFSQQFPGRIWLEVLLASGVTGMLPEVKEIAALTNKLRIEKVQLNTVSRPAYEDFASAVDFRQLQKFAGLFSCPVEILKDAPSSDLLGINGSEASGKDILDLLARRPCTLEGICLGLGLHPHDVVKRLKGLIDQHRISSMRAGHGLFYKISEENKTKGQPMEKEVIENHEKYLDRVALYQKFGYDIDKERSLIIEKACPLTGKILEAGTGKGHFTLALARAGFNFFSFDISVEEQRYALLNLMYYGLQQQVTFVVADVDAIPCDDDFFDVIFAVNMMHHLSSVRKTCDEFVRILSPQGKIVLSDFNEKGFSMLDNIHGLEERRHEVSGGTLDQAKVALSERGFELTEYHAEMQNIVVARCVTKHTTQ